MAPPPKISQKTHIQQIDKGGLKLCHYETKVKALKLSWIKRLTSETDSTWRTLPKYTNVTILIPSLMLIIDFYQIQVFLVFT